MDKKFLTDDIDFKVGYINLLRENLVMSDEINKLKKAMILIDNFFAILDEGKNKYFCDKCKEELTALVTTWIKDLDKEIKQND